MVAAAAAAVVSAAARRFSTSASTVIMREVSGCHKFTIDGCTASRKFPQEWQSISKNFTVAGSSWRIGYQPNGKGEDYISLFLELDPVVHGDEHCSPAVRFTFTLLDPAGNPVTKFSRSSQGVCSFHGNARRQGFSFIRWKHLEESGCLKDDRFSVRCDVTAIESCHQDDAAAAAAGAQVAVPPSNLHEHLSNLLWKKQGADVTIDVGGETLDAHGWLLGVRSPVLEAELHAATKEKVPGGAVRRRMEIQGVEHRVFEAMLHFLYTDRLPEIAEQDAVAMARGLVAAAHRYQLDRLKLMCEETLCRRVDMGTVAGSLAVAEKHECRVLKAACVELLARPGNLKAIAATDGFEKMKADCPAALLELFVKQLP